MSPLCLSILDSFLSDVPALRELVGEWEKVTVFFLLRQVLAPCVESLVLLDRVLFMREQGTSKINAMLN